MEYNIILIKALQLICSLSLLVVLHEGGHFLFAKLNGVKVEKFYMFFNPYFHLFSTRDKWFTRLFPYFKDNETEYGIGWIPLGGYVSISGMVDETKDAKDITAEVHDYDFMSKKVWQRFLIMFGGVLVNFITAFVLYTAIMYTWGQEVLPIRNITDGLVYNQQAKEIGFRNGDLPIKADGEEIANFDGNLLMLISEANTVTVLRDGKEVELTMPEGGVSLLEMSKSPHFLSMAIPPIVAEVPKGTPAHKAGITPGTRILQLDDKTIEDASDVSLHLLSKQDILNAEGCTHKDSLQAMRLVSIVRYKDAKDPDTLTLQLGNDLKMGVVWDLAHQKNYKTETLHYSLLESIPAGCRHAWTTFTNYVSSLKYLFSKEGAQSVGSFITIANLFPSMWDWQIFWNMTAFLSIILAVMNILPIPGLDGGHIMILLYEAIVGRQPSPKAMEYIEKVGLLLLLALMILALGNDFFRYIL